MSKKATRPRNSAFHGFVASTALVAGSDSVMIHGAPVPREVPSTHSAYAVTDRRRGRPDWFATVSTDSFTGASGWTNWTRSSWMPLWKCWKRLYPAPWRATYVDSGRRIGCAVGLQTSPLSSSRTYSASTGGSLTGSFDHGVSWFSRLLPAQV